MNRLELIVSKRLLLTSAANLSPPQRNQLSDASYRAQPYCPREVHAPYRIPLTLTSRLA